jgi:sugar lactone lactonase YvrE
MNGRAKLVMIACMLFGTASCAVPAWAQQEQTLDAIRGRFADAGARIRAIRRGPDGFYYILTARLLAESPDAGTSSNSGKSSSKRVNPETPLASTVLVFDSQGKQVREIARGAGPGGLVSASALDLDVSGRIYIADQAGNAVVVYTAAGAPFAHFSVPEPTQIVALPDDRFAVCSASGDHLISVYDLHGALLRQIGAFADLSDDPELNHMLNEGALASDKSGNLYFGFRYFPEPTVRKYDSHSGSALDELSITTPDFEPMAQAARQQIARLTSGNAVLPHEIISAMGVDPETQELWLALGNLLMHFDSSDTNTGSARTYTVTGARMVPSFILPEKDDLLLGNAEFGIYEFSRKFHTIPNLP